MNNLDIREYRYKDKIIEKLNTMLKPNRLAAFNQCGKVCNKIKRNIRL